MSAAHLPVVAVVGRPNVGKSTFFNRIIGRRLAIVDDQPGVTRDRNFARADWSGRHFFIVDTGGIIEGSDEPLDRAVRAQAMAAVAEAHVILLVVDSKDGVHPLDEKLAEVLRKTDRPVLMVANKVDNLPRDTSYLDFWSMGMGEPHPVSAISGKGTGDLLDAVVDALPPADQEPQPPEEVRVAVIGKPNVGKSSFVNRLFGEERVVVSEVAGTTRDPVDTPMAYHGRTLVFVDTAGLRRHARIQEPIEYYSSLRTARVVQDADVALVLVDATEPLHGQDVKVAEMAWEAGCGVILVVNKWDLVEKDDKTAPAFERHIREKVPFLKWVPVLFASALSGQRVRRTLDLVLEVQEQRARRIPTPEVNDVLQALVQRQPPPHARGRQVKLRYATQVTTEPPMFVAFSNMPGDVPEHYIRYIHNGFRERWGFMGTPVRIRIRASNDPEGR
ncbi:MAG: ribosome biogenesis GTPase Der [Gemmatimonadetes bacterium]|nr:ribosome biogenesis GTPase Der [Gemmatimonadota bacterium]